MTCSQLKELLRTEIPNLQMEIDKHKYYLSQKLNVDVGVQFAERDYLSNYLEPWATGYKECFCSNVCKEWCERRC
jgi:hypothetical protein